MLLLIGESDAGWVGVEWIGVAPADEALAAGLCNASLLHLVCHNSYAPVPVPDLALGLTSSLYHHSAQGMMALAYEALPAHWESPVADFGMELGILGGR